MSPSSKKPSKTTERENMTEAQLRDKIKAKLLSRGISDPTQATAEQLYQATVHVIKDIMSNI